MKRCWALGSKLVVLMVCMGLAGCGGRATVSGTVTYNGKPLPSGSVTFYGADNQPVSAAIQSDGTYHMPKAPTGEVKATVMTAASVKPASAGPGGPPQQPITKAGPKDMSKSQIPGSGGAEAPKASIAIPGQYANPDTSGLKYSVHRGKNTINIDLK